jgi:hypothetical protein
MAVWVRRVKPTVRFVDGLYRFDHLELTNILLPQDTSESGIA